MSTSDVNFGLWYDFRNPPGNSRGFGDFYRATLDQITWAESIGIDSVWLTEHHFMEDGYTPSPFLLASAIGDRTTTMKIGTNLVVSPLHNPIRLAEDSATLSLLTGGRFSLGVGQGYWEPEFEAFDRRLINRPSLLEEGVESYALVDALAGLAAVDHSAIGLDDFGKPDGFLERQVPRWLAEHERYAGTPGYPGGTFPDLDRIAGWLDDNRPAEFRPGLLHGDYHVANVLYDHRTPEVAAIVDWEMATVGDPLLDLGVLLAIWPDDPRQPDLYESALGQAGDLPNRSAIIARYAERSERNLDALDWYTVLASFKLGIILEGTYARSCDGKAPRKVGERLHRYADSLFVRAREIIAGA